jgi:DNA-binding transcriptional regulator YiaG
MPSQAELRAWLKSKGYGPADAARYLHVNIRTVQRWLSGHRKVPNWLEAIIRSA